MSEFSFLSRFGPVLLTGGIAAMPTSVYRYQRELKLSPQHVWFIGVILSYQWDTRLPYPSLSHLAHEVGLSRQQLTNYEQTLVRAGLLRVEHRFKANHGQTSSEFDFRPLFARIEAYLRRDRQRSGSASIPSAPPVSSEQVNPLPTVADTALSTPSMQTPTMSTAVDTTLSKGVVTPCQPQLTPPVNPGLHEVDSLNVDPIKIDTREVDRTGLPRSIRHEAPAIRNAVRTETTTEEVPTNNGPATSSADPTSASRAKDTGPDITMPPAAEAKALIGSYVTDYALLFNAQTPIRVSIARAIACWEHSGLSVRQFIARMQKARELAQGHTVKSLGMNGRITRMASWFSILDDITNRNRQDTHAGARHEPEAVPTQECPASDAPSHSWEPRPRLRSGAMSA